MRLNAARAGWPCWRTCARCTRRGPRAPDCGARQAVLAERVRGRGVRRCLLVHGLSTNRVDLLSRLDAS